MTKYLLAALAVALSGCAHTEVTLLFGPRTDGHYTELAGNLTVLRRMGGRKVCAWEHQSEVRNGPPLNNRPEIHTDMLGCGLRFSR